MATLPAHTSPPMEAAKYSSQCVPTSSRAKKPRAADEVDGGQYLAARQRVGYAPERLGAEDGDQPDQADAQRTGGGGGLPRKRWLLALERGEN